MKSLEAVTGLPVLSNFFWGYPAKSHGTSRAKGEHQFHCVRIDSGIYSVGERKKNMEEYLSLK